MILGNVNGNRLFDFLMQGIAYKITSAKQILKIKPVLICRNIFTG